MDVPDALQRLKIVPKDETYIDLTATQDMSPRIKLEQGTASIGVTALALPSVSDRDKKRRALEAQLEDIEEEERAFELKQRKRRVQRELARFEEDAE